ncbi:nucleic acid-binding protein [Sistotremastrum niveocremeum HHB9708]|uniref:Nucleic acid-binding protein n=1 Tax=Sistotremastrum niveocremeum HHB9708 TaxID=1314777 RepID=A0A164ZC79_9AGAM|nr:nucleic acid-binding protein [Sistotremastrum niveocremeum HHB9708]
MLASARQTLIAHARSRTFASSSPAATMAKLVLIGRMGRDPEVRTTKNDKEYVSYVVATRNSPPPPNADGVREEPKSSWHNILSFGPNQSNYLKSIRKGSLVYVEANYELREPDPNASPDSPEGQRQIFLRHETIRVLKKPNDESASSDA